MENLPEVAQLLKLFHESLDYVTGWLKEYAFVLVNLAQILLIGVAFLVAKLTTPRVTAWIEKKNARAHRFRKQVEIALWVLIPLMLPVVWLVLLWITALIFNGNGWSQDVLRAVVSLLTAWVIIRLMSNAFTNRSWSKAIAVMAWTVAALNIVGLLGATVELLDAVAFNMGDLRLSLLGALKAAASLALLLWLAGLVSKLAERRLATAHHLSPSSRVLFGKLARILLYMSAILIGLESVGIDLTALAVFTGAVGFGIGFGLQKVFSNLISGVILLLDKSVKPGDVIAVGDTFGWINSLGARYVSLITRDGIEHLIPNDDLINQRVENWSYSNQMVRLKLPVGISYDADPRQAIELTVEAARATRRVLQDPAPVCRLMGFGDSSVDLELRVWIQDPQNGVANVRSDILLAIWDMFHEHHIEFPYPHRDINIRSLPEGASLISQVESGAGKT
ncbi:mechanosensitive ion channel [Magnetospira thiophila]